MAIGSGNTPVKVPTPQEVRELQDHYKLREQLVAAHPPVQWPSRPPLVAPPEIDRWGTPLKVHQEIPEVYDVNDWRRQGAMLTGVSPMSMLAMRMRWGPYSQSVSEFHAPPIPFDHMAIHLNDQEAIIFLVHNGKPVTLVDKADMFPSDQLVGQIHILVAGKDGR